MSETIQRATPPTNTVPGPNLALEYTHRAAWKAGVLGALNVLTMVLAARMMVLVAVAGAIALTWLTMGNPDPYRLIGLGIYCLLAVVPCVVLAAMGR